MRKKYNRKKKVKPSKYLRMALICVTFALLFLLCSKRIDASAFFLHETLPGFAMSTAKNEKTMYKFAQAQPTEADAAENSNADMAAASQNGLISMSGVIGVNDVDLQPETESETNPQVKLDAVSFGDITKLRDLSYLKNNFYIVDSRTMLTSADFDVDAMVNEDLKINNSEPGPKVLIFHTHSSEMFADSDPDNPLDGVMGCGEKLAQILNDTYGIETLHNMGRYDVVNGAVDRDGAYERTEPAIEKILAQYPSIQVCIDLHRDGVPDTTHLVTNINGVPTAQIMFFNGLCKVNQDGQLVNYSLSNPYVPDNLAFSFKSQLTANELYPDFTRRIYLNAYRYSLNMLPRSMLVEVGAQTNTVAEAQNAMGPLAKVLAEVLLNE